MAKTSPTKRAHTKGITPTGFRRFFFKLEMLAKRRPNLVYDYSNLDPVVETPPPAKPCGSSILPKPPSHIHKRPLVERNKPVPPYPLSAPLSAEPAWPQAERVAIINEDYSEDAVVISVLEDIPFCCHEDLITMSREQIIGVAQALNAKLPSAMEIDTDHVLPTSFIRSTIERIVGLRPDVPPAPKVLRLMTDSESDRRLLEQLIMREQRNKTPPTSPLASRSKSYGALPSLISPRLARLVEEDEGMDDDDEADRHNLKKRRLSFESKGRGSDGDDNDSDADMISAGPESPTPLSRFHFQGAQLFPKVPSPSPVPTRILRSHSQRSQTRHVIDTALLDQLTARARYQKKVNPRPADPASRIPKPIGVRRSLRPVPSRVHRPFSNLGSPARSFSSFMDNGASQSASLAGTKRKRASSGGVGRTEAERHMTNGIRMMNMSSADSDKEMDVGP
ncbi:hypothetical protein H0H81_004143 [Sphagnurus paluster]|uniref:Uncharacterized protein n=1 Tax=Sphagnurus paluster TaxID=117069 RepID=A0A9P7FUV1_9AGAR|nr:hypothetical protein H0H81_004143 [Sphagnurus paluster]